MGKINLECKNKVHQEFRQIQQEISQIQQDKIEPTGPEPEPPAVLKKHLFDNPDILTQSEQRLPPGAGTAVVGYDSSADLHEEVLKMGLLT